MEARDFNLRCDSLKRQLVELIDNSGLPVAAIYYIWKTLDSDIEKKYYAVLNTALLKQEKPVKEV